VATQALEHTVRDDAGFEALCDYIHYNPVRHGVVQWPHLWPYSGLARFMRANRYDEMWNCSCKKPSPTLDFGDIGAFIGNEKWWVDTADPPSSV
jgi:putative transposase